MSENKASNHRNKSPASRRIAAETAKKRRRNGEETAKKKRPICAMRRRLNYVTLSNLINSNVILTRWYTPTHGAIGRGRERDIERERERRKGRMEKCRARGGEKKGDALLLGKIGIVVRTVNNADINHRRHPR